ncbi:hypothetical protein FRX31_023722 [Thalictrum thalictroides]|uniref:Uncharacterized protein n=1 Tax=Thalictrum thalictroides TaxID=46969 RepID=A0A7J6VR68_THATH|nr:hypothetical protein FRX31_023722 [Thalictrum thalictroides]
MFAQKLSPSKLKFLFSLPSTTASINPHQTSLLQFSLFSSIKLCQDPNPQIQFLYYRPFSSETEKLSKFPRARQVRQRHIIFSFAVFVVSTCKNPTQKSLVASSSLQPKA